MFHFTIRDLLWLMALVAMGCARWGDQRTINDLRSKAMQFDFLFKQAGLRVEYGAQGATLHRSYEGEDLILGTDQPPKSGQ